MGADFFLNPPLPVPIDWDEVADKYIESCRENQVLTGTTEEFKEHFVKFVKKVLSERKYR